MVFQDPFASLNPFHSIRTTWSGRCGSTGREDGRRARRGRRRAPHRVNLTPPGTFAEKRPHEMSGQRQRVAIARRSPRLPVPRRGRARVDARRVDPARGAQPAGRCSARRTRRPLHHARPRDGAHFSDEILVMFRGNVVERGPSDQVILDPQHEYTKLLLGAAPEPQNHGRLREEVRRELAAAAAGGGDAVARDRFGTRGM
nr:hypothetical protein [Cellulosimicrobium sp. MM]